MRLVAAEEQYAVLATEAEAVGHGVVERVAGVLVGAHIEVDAFVLVEHVRGRMNHLILQGLHGDDGFKSTGGAESVADHALGRVHLEAVGGAGKDLLESGAFSNVAERSRSTVGVHVAHILRGNTGFAESHFDSEADAFAVFTRGGHVVSISAHADAGHASENVGATLLGVREAFEHENARTFTDHETVAVLIERTRGRRRVVVALAQGLHGGKACESDIVHGFVGTTGEHDIGAAKTNLVVGGGDRVVRGCASGNHCVAGAHPAGAVGNFASGHVHDRHRNEERGHAARATVRKRNDGIAIDLHTADTGTDNHARTGRIFVFGRNTGVLKSLERSIHSVLDAPREAGRIARGNKFRTIEFLDGGSYLDRIVGHVEAIDRCESGFTFQQVVPKEFRRIAEGGNTPHTSDYDFFHNAPKYRKKANLLSSILSLICRII